MRNWNWSVASVGTFIWQTKGLFNQLTKGEYNIFAILVRCIVVIWSVLYSWSHGWGMLHRCMYFHCHPPLLKFLLCFLFLCAFLWVIRFPFNSKHHTSRWIGQINSCLTPTVPEILLILTTITEEEWMSESALSQWALAHTPRVYLLMCTHYAFRFGYGDSSPMWSCHLTGCQVSPYWTCHAPTIEIDSTWCGKVANEHILHTSCFSLHTHKWIINSKEIYWSCTNLSLCYFFM